MHQSESDRFIKEVYRLSPVAMLLSTNPIWPVCAIIFSPILGKLLFTAHVSDEVILGNFLDPKCGMHHMSKGEVHLRLFTSGSI